MAKNRGRFGENYIGLGQGSSQTLLAVVKLSTDNRTIQLALYNMI